MLLHVLDASSPFMAQQRATVRATLRELNLPAALLAGCIEVYTKADLLDDCARRQLRASLDEDLLDETEGGNYEGGNGAKGKGNTGINGEGGNGVHGEGGDDGNGGNGGNDDNDGNGAVMGGSCALRGGALLVSAVDGSGLSELTGTISAHLDARLGRARQTLRLPLDGKDSGRVLSQQLSFLHGHPRVSVVEQRDSHDGTALVVTADMDIDTYHAFVGRRWS